MQKSITIKTKRFSTYFLEDILGNISAEKLETSIKEGGFLHGDTLYFGGDVCFTMIDYSFEAVSKQDKRSRYVTYWSELYNSDIEIDRLNNEVTINSPCRIDWYRTKGISN